MEATLKVFENSNTVDFLKATKIKPDTKRRLGETVMMAAATIAVLAAAILGVSICSVVVGLPLLTFVIAPIFVSMPFLLISLGVATVAVVKDPEFFKDCLANVVKDIKEEINKPGSQIGKDLKDLGRAIKEDVIRIAKAELTSMKHDALSVFFPDHLSNSEGVVPDTTD